MSNIKEYIASRVSVFDAATLDREINEFLKKQIHHIIAELPLGQLNVVGTLGCGACLVHTWMYFMQFGMRLRKNYILAWWVEHNGNYAKIVQKKHLRSSGNGIPHIDAEIDAILRVLLWMFSVERNRATFGQQLLRLKYGSNVSAGKLRLLGALTIGHSYLKERSDCLHHFKAKLPYWVDFCFRHFEFALNVLNVLSFLAFLRRGGSHRFIDNLLGVHPVSTAKPSERSIGYSYMTRALLWHGAIELCCLVLPHVNLPKLGRIARHAVFGKSSIPPASRPPVFSSQVKCSICRQYPIVPHTIGCQHFFCFFCISSCLLADQKYGCPDCGYSNPEGLATRWDVK